MLAEEKRWGNPDSLFFDRAVLDSAYSHMEGVPGEHYSFFDPDLLLSHFRSRNGRIYTLSLFSFFTVWTPQDGVPEGTEGA